MAKKFIFICSVAAVVILADFFCRANSVCAADRVWVPEHRLASGTVIPGHWRPAKKPGFAWVAGQRDGPTWIAGYWKPVGTAPAGKIWAKGHWKNGRWHDGNWAPKKKGTWVPGHYGRGGRRIPGHYR